MMDIGTQTIVDREKEALNKIIKKCPELKGVKIERYPINDPSFQYYGKVFIYVLELKEGFLYSPSEKIPKKWVRKVHIRPYKISDVDEIVTNTNKKSAPFKNPDSKLRIDYDSSTGNFHKLVDLDKEDLEFQVVLVADRYEDGTKVGKEACCPGIPRDFPQKDKFIKKDGVNILSNKFLKAVDEMGMYFPKLSEPPKSDLYEVLKDALGQDFIERLA